MSDLRRKKLADLMGQAVAADIPAGGDVKIALCRVGGSIHAFENVCPHAYALLSDGFVEDTEIECPLHAARFDIATGECLGPPADRDLVIYPVKVEGHEVFVDVSR